MNRLTRRQLLLGLATGSALLPKTGMTKPLGEGGSQPSTLLGRGGGIHHTAVRTREWDRTLGFYQSVLGFHVKLAWREVLGTMDERLGAAASQPRNQRWAYLDSGGGACIEIFEDSNFVPPAAGTTDPTNTSGSPIVHMGIRTSRIEQVWKAARAWGSSDLGPPTDYTLNTTTGQGPITVRLCFVQGPSGEWIELIQNAP